MADDGAEGVNLRNRILIVDVIGELGAWWGVADAAYVGGSMGTRGGQNMIEPAAYGIPVARASKPTKNCRLSITAIQIAVYNPPLKLIRNFLTHIIRQFVS